MEKTNQIYKENVSARIFKPIISMIASSFLFVKFGTWRIKDVFDIWYAGHDKSPTIRKIFQEVYADDYLADVDASSFVTKTDLQYFVRYLSIGQGDTFIDLGCGRGGPGLWVARETGANLIGIDISEVAVKEASHRISDFSLNQTVRFQVGSFEKTGLPDACCDGAMSIDALFFVFDKIAAVREVHRILRQGARFVFTSWEGNRLVTVKDRILIVKDHIHLLKNAGFDIELYEETKDWKIRQAAIYKRIIKEKDNLIEEMGRAAANVWIKDAANVKYLDRRRRVLVTAKKQ